MIVKVGNDSRPAGKGDIKDAKKQIKKAFKKLSKKKRREFPLILVTHHCFDASILDTKN
jgi:hypothetical protein